jgi:hypothetical protein
MGVGVALYLLFAFVHVKRADAQRDTVFQPAVFWCFAAYLTLNMVGLLTAMMIYAAGTGDTLLLMVQGAVLALPVAVSIVQGDWKGACMVANPVRVLMYLLASPVYVGLLGIYAILRLADLSWGNRPTCNEGRVAAGDVADRPCGRLLGLPAQRCAKPAVGQRYCSDCAWECRQVLKVQLFNATVVLSNLSLMWFSTSLLRWSLLLMVLVNWQGILLQTMVLIMVVCSRTLGGLRLLAIALENLEAMIGSCQTGCCQTLFQRVKSAMSGRPASGQEEAAEPLHIGPAKPAYDDDVMHDVPVP